MHDETLEFPRAVFFDWDGTLADTYQFLNDAHNHLLSALDLPVMKEGEYAQYFGMPREVLYPKIYGAKAEAAKKLFEAYVYENGHRIRPLQGAPEFLATLKSYGVVMGVVSNKKGNFIAKEIEHFGWTHDFEAVVGAGEAEADKPSGAPLLLALKRAGVVPDKDSVWFVGDTKNDLECARDAGCLGVYVRGHEDPAPLIKAYAPRIYGKDFKELHQILIAIAEK